MKPKKCKAKGCGQEFTPRRPMQKACSPSCALSIVKASKEKAEADKLKADRKKDRERREELKTRSDWMKEAQRAFNAYIRARDYGRPCISCGCVLNFGGIGGGVDAGHYRSVGSAPHARFSEINTNAQCVKCNRFGSGRAVDYRRGLIERVGALAVEMLEADQTPRKYTIEDLRAIRDEYRKKARELERNRND